MKSLKHFKNEISEDAPATNTSNVDGADGDPNIGPSGKFAGCHIFRVNQTMYNQCIKGKKKYAHWKDYVDIGSTTGMAIRDYAYKYPRRPIIVQNENDGHMVYLRNSRYGRGKKK